MPISFGQPGALRKTFDDKIFDLTGGVYHKVPCPLKAGFNLADLKDGRFLASDGAGKFEKAADANRNLYMIFTANTKVIVKQVTAADEFPGEDRTDTPTGLVGEIIGIWPVEELFVGDRGTEPVTLADYVGNAPLTVVDGKLCVANVGGLTGEKVVGYVEADSNVVGANSIAARISI